MTCIGGKRSHENEVLTIVRADRGTDGVKLVQTTCWKCKVAEIGFAPRRGSR